MDFLLSTALFKIASYISSLILASGYFYFESKEAYPIAATVQLVIALISTLYVIIYFHAVFRHPELNNIETIEIVEVRQEKFDTSNYLFSNILPILTLDINEKSGIALCCILVFILGIIHYKNDLFYINPIFDILNKYTYTAKVIINKSPKSKETMIVSNQKIYNFNRQFTQQYARAVVKNNIVIVDKIL